MILILCEKPSAARNFAKAFGGMNGTCSGLKYRIFALRGHVLELVDPTAQVDNNKVDISKTWNLSQLPWNLQDFSWNKTICSGCISILKNLKTVLNETKEVVIATDDDPSGEGELIAWEALIWCSWKGNTTRMHFIDESKKSLLDAFKHRVKLKNPDHDGAYLGAIARQRWDFASMQLVRGATCIAKDYGWNKVVRQGRLKSVIVKLVGDQEQAYKNYKRVPFYEARFKDENGIVYAHKFDQSEAIRFRNAEDVDLSVLHSSPVVEDSRKLKHSAPGQLLDLAGLSALLAKQGFKPDNVLKTYQKLYEDQLVSYPRTEDITITHEMFVELLPLVDSIADLVGVDKELLTYRKPRQSHVKNVGTHGANRPGPRVPHSLDQLKGYGIEAQAIYTTLAKNYLAMLAPDYEYTLVKGHIKDFSDYVGETKVPVSLGFKKIFDKENFDDEEAVLKQNNSDLGSIASPFIFEGTNKRPQKPTMNWLNKRLESFNVGTGATRTSTLADISRNNTTALIKETKGILTLTQGGSISYELLDGCDIASPEVTEQLFESMKAVLRFEKTPAEIVNSVTFLVEHDIAVMQANGSKIASLIADENTDFGTCPVCGEPLVNKKSLIECSSNKNSRLEDGTWKLDAGCGFKLFKKIAGKTLTDKQLLELIEHSQTKRQVKGLKSKTGKSFSAYITLDKNTGKTGFKFATKN